MTAVGRLLRFVWNHPLNSEGRVTALARVLQWQVRSRVFSGPFEIPFVNGTRLLAARGMTGATGNWYCGLHELAEMAFVLHLLRSSDYFLDVGANIGSYTVLGAGVVGACTTAVEPVPSTFNWLQRNVRLNEIESRVRCVRCGVGSEPGYLEFTTDRGTVNRVVCEGEDEASVCVPVTTLDDLVGDRVPLMIKIDVEGFEERVLKGGSRVLRDPRLLAVCMETDGATQRYGAAPGTLMKSMEEYGFLPVSYEPLKRRLSPSVGLNGPNTIFVRDADIVMQRVVTAPQFRLVNGFI